MNKYYKVVLFILGIGMIICAGTNAFVSHDIFLTIISLVAAVLDFWYFFTT